MSETIEPITVEGEGLTVPLLVWNRFHAPMPGLVERIYAENRGLARLGAFLPVGTVVNVPIPSAPRVEVLTPVRLWS